MSELLFETDWMASRPAYYNVRTGAAGSTINEVIDFAELELDNEGFNAFLGSGCCIYERTPVRDVLILPQSARLWREDDGALRVEELPLDLEARLARRYSEDEIVDMLRERVRRAEAAAEADLVIPTSGGYDSRLLNLMVAEPAKVRSFTFGPSARQWDSEEVARARALAELLGSRWERIPIGLFHDELDGWDDVFGPAMHAHGMYQMEFYCQVAARVAPGSLVLSGLGGDWLEGKGDWAIPPVRSPAEVRGLHYVARQHADITMSRLPWSGELAEEYFARNREGMLETHVGRVLEAMRFRFKLTHYLVLVPELYGMHVDTPFLDMDLACAMMGLPPERREHRAWVTDYLRDRGALLEDAAGSDEYWLYWPAMRRRPLAPLDAALLAEVVRPAYVRWINRSVGPLGLWQEGAERLSYRRGFRRAAGALRRRGIQPRRLDAYNAYMTLWPIQRLLEKRDAARAAVV